jgi:hypothetical protein
MTARKKATVQGVGRVTASLDQLADTFQHHAESLGVPVKVAMDFAYRCDLLSDAMDRGKTAGYFNPAEIGVEVPGPLVSDPNNPFMAGEFTQQEFFELADKQMSGALEAAAAAHRADPVIASLIKKEAAKLAFDVLNARAAKGKPFPGAAPPFGKKDEKKDEEPKKEAKKSEVEKDEEEVLNEASKSASAHFRLFETK